MDREEIVIDLSATELGEIDILVEQGLYPSRSDFIHTAVQQQLAERSKDVKDFLKQQSSQFMKSQYSETSITATAGILKLGRKELEGFKASRLKVNIRIVGLLMIDNDVTPELAKETIKSVKVYGVIRASEEVKKVLLSK